MTRWLSDAAPRRHAVGRANAIRAGLSLALLVVLLFAGPQMQPQTKLHRGVAVLKADARTLGLAQAGGFDTVVQLFSWRQIEPTQGQYHWQYPDEVVQGAAYYGLNLVIRLDQHPAWAAAAPLTVNAPPDDPAAFAAFAGAVAARYRGRVLGYIIWNEPNLALEWGGRPPDPVGYAGLLRAAYPAIKAADPAARVISAGLASTNDRTASALDDRQYLEALYAAGAGRFFDVLGAHPYGFAYPPDDPHGNHDGLNMTRLADLRAIMVSHGDAAKPIWATEMGWTVRGAGATAWQTVSPDRQAAYLAQAFDQARRTWPWLGLMAVWNLDGGDAPEWAGYSLLDASGAPGPAYRGLQRQGRGKTAAALPATDAAPTGATYQVLAADSVVHLGHRDYPAPWLPLYGAASPSTVWRGAFYLPQPGRQRWRLTVELMQSNTWGNHVTINGHRLDPVFPPEDYSATWVTAAWDVPPGFLRAGPNQIEIHIGQAAPLLQDTPFTWDDLQFKNIALRATGTH